MKYILKLELCLLATLIIGCSDDDKSTDKKDGKNEINFVLPKMSPATEIQTDQIKHYAQLLHNIEIQDLVLYKNNESSEDSYNRKEKIKQLPTDVQSFIDDIYFTNNCKVEPISYTKTSSPEKFQVGQVTTEIGRGTISSQNTLCGLNANSSSTHQSKVTQFKQQGDDYIVSLDIDQNSNMKSKFLDQNIIQKYFLIEHTTETTNKGYTSALIAQDGDYTITDLFLKGTTTTAYTFTDSTISVQTRIEIKQTQTSIQMSIHVEHNLPTGKVILSIFQKSANQYEYYINGVPSTPQQIEEIFGPTTSSVEKMSLSKNLLQITQ